MKDDASKVSFFSVPFLRHDRSNCPTRESQSKISFRPAFRCFRPRFRETKLNDEIVTPGDSFDSFFFFFSPPPLEL